MNAWYDYALGWFADYYLLSTLLLAVVLVTGSMMRQPARRLVLAWATVGSLALLGALLAVPGWSVVHLLGAPPPMPEAAAAIIERTNRLPETPVAQRPFQELPVVTQPGAPFPELAPSDPVTAVPNTVMATEIYEFNLSPYILAPLVVGCAIVFGWLVLGAWQTYRMVRGSNPSPPEVESMLSALCDAGDRRPHLRLSQWVATGVALGLVRPMILLPQSYADRQDAEGLRLVLAHELAHLRRGDLWMLAAIRCLMIVLWAHPLYWLFRRRVRLDQETLADSAAAELTSRTRYAEQLVGWARQLDHVHPPTLAGAVGLWETKSQLRKRIAVLLDERLTILRHSSRKWKLAALVLCGTVALGLSLMTVEPGKAVAEETRTSGVDEAASEEVDNSSKRPANQKGVLEGRVVDDEGTPVAGAEVGLVVGNSDPGDEERLVTTVLTNSQGYYMLPLDEGQLRELGSLWARASGHSPTRDNGTWVLAALDNKEDFELVLPRAEFTDFVLLDADRNPVPDATVGVEHIRVTRGVGYQLPERWRGDYRATSDAEGRVRVANMLPDSVDTVTIESPNAGRLRYDLNYFLNEDPASAAPHYTVCIPPTASLAGTAISDAEDAPLQTPITFVSEVRPPWGTSVGVWGEQEVVPDEEGKFEVPSIAAGYVRTDWQGDTSKPWRAMTGAPQRIEPDGFANFAVKIVPGVEVRGRVVKSDTGEGYARFRLTLVHGPTERESKYGESGEWLELETDEQGWYAALLPPGYVKLRINSAPEDYHADEWWKPEAESLNRTPRQIPTGVTAFEMPALELVQTRYIQGQLVDKNERPLNGWSVYGFPSDAKDVMNSFPGVETRREGKFAGYVPETQMPTVWKVSFRDWTNEYSFEDKKYTPKIVSEDPLVLQVDVDGRTRAEREAEETKAERGSNEPENETTPQPAVPTETLEIRVVDENGKPVEGATITPSGLRAPNDGSWYGWNENDPSWPPNKVYRSDADGRVSVVYPKYVFERKPTSVLIVDATHADFVDDDTELPIESPNPTVVLKSGGRIEVSATLADGSAPPDRLFGVLSGFGIDDARTVRPGVIRSQVLASEKKTLRVVYLPEEGPVQFSPLLSVTPEVGEAVQLSASLRPGTRLLGELDDSVPRPVTGGYVIAQVVTSTGGGWSDTVDISEDGTFVIESLPYDEGEVVQLIGVCDGFVSTPPGGWTDETEQPEPQTANLGASEVRHTLTMIPSAKAILRFKNKTGEPIEGVKVQLCPNVVWRGGGSMLFAHPKTSSRSYLLNPNWREEKQNPEDNPFFGESDAEGQIVLLNLPPNPLCMSMAMHDEYQLPARELLASLTGIRPRMFEVTLRPGEFTERDIVMEPKGNMQLGTDSEVLIGEDETAADPTKLSGIVLDPDGKPMADVDVDAWTWHPGNETKTDTEGRFELDGFDPGMDVEIEFTKPGYCPRYFVNKSAGSRGWVVRMSDDTWFEGMVTDADGEPVADVEIRAERGPFENDNGIIGEVKTTTKTDAKGRYQLMLEPDTYSFKIRDRRGQVFRQADLILGRGEHLTKNLKLTPGLTFRAKVIDSETGEPVEGITLWNWRHNGIEGSSGADGMLEIPGMFPGAFEFQVTAKGMDRYREWCAGDYARWWSPDATNEYQRKLIEPATFQRNFDHLDFDLDGVSGPLDPVTVFVEKCAVVRGRVVDPDGKPVAGATVAPAKTGSGNSLTGDTRFSYTTKEDGTFESKLPASGGVIYNLVAHDGKYGEWRNWANGIGQPMVTSPGEVIDDVELQLTRGATVRGRVLDAAGKPIAQTRVRAAAMDKFDNRYYLPEVRTDAEGRYELKFIRPGKHLIQAEPFWLQAEQAPAGTSRQVELEAGQVLERVILAPPGAAIEQELDVDDQTGEAPPNKDTKITAVVVNEDGEKIPGARILHGNGQLAQDGDDGKLHIRCAPGQQFTVRAYAKGYRLWYGAPRAGDDLRIVLKRLPQNADKSTMRVIVVDSVTAEPIPGVSIEAKRWDNVSDKTIDARGVTDARGQVELSGLKANLYRLGLSADKPIPYIGRQHRTGTAGDQDVVLPLDRACELVLRAVDSETGEPVAGVRFGREQMYAENWMQDIVPDILGDDSITPAKEDRLTNERGEYRCLVAPDTWSYMIAKHPEGYRSVVPVNGSQEVELTTPIGGSVEYEFKLVAERSEDRETDLGDSNESPAGTPRTDFTIVIAKHMMLLDGKEVITWQELEHRIAKLPDPSKARLNYRLTHAAMEDNAQDLQRAEHQRLEEKFKFNGYSLGSLSLRGSHRFDQLETAADLLNDRAHACVGQVVDSEGKPVDGVEVIYTPPVDENLAYRGRDIYLEDGKLRHHLDDVVAVSDERGRFTVYPASEDVQYYLIATHPEHGFALVTRQGREPGEPIQLAKWASINSTILPAEGMEQTASVTTSVAEKEGLPDLSINIYVPDRRPKPKQGEFNFPCVPPNLPCHYRRGIQKRQGLTISLPTEELTLKPGEVKEITLGGLSPDEADRLLLHEQLMEDLNAARENE